MPSTLLQQIEAAAIFSQIRGSTYAYPVLLWIHLGALIVWGGMMLVTDLRLLGVVLTSTPVADLIKGLRWPKRVSFVLAALAGLLLFGSKAELYSFDPAFWNNGFWIKMTLLALLGLNYLILRRAPLQMQRLRLAGVLSLLLWGGAVWAARGPATVKDIMHTMVDPSGDFLFQSVRIIGDENGVREIAPETDEQWQDVRARLNILMDALGPLSAPHRRAARARDRSQSPAIENEPIEVQALLNADRADFARRAQRLHDAASVAMRSVDAKDKAGLLHALDGIDTACELCHLHYWYPRDQRARQAAKESGVLDEP